MVEKIRDQVVITTKDIRSHVTLSPQTADVLGADLALRGGFYLVLWYIPWSH